jgi:hypothetical protein
VTLRRALDAVIERPRGAAARRVPASRPQDRRPAIEQRGALDGISVNRSTRLAARRRRRLATPRNVSTPNSGTARHLCLRVPRSTRASAALVIE